MNRNQSNAERFAAAVDRMLEESLPPTAESMEQPLLDLAYRLWRTGPQGVISPLFRAALRRRLVQRWHRSDQGEGRYAVVDSPVGRIAVAYRGTVICGVGWAMDDTVFEQRCVQRWGVRPNRDTVPPEWLVRRVWNHLTGKRVFRGAVDLCGLTPFQQRVLAKVREIPRGEVRSYTWVAREIGHPKAVRAVGTALGNNPIPLLIPCHRVIQSTGGLGGYTAGGTALKKQLLTFEGVDVVEVLTLMRRGKRFRGSRNTHIFCLPTCHSRKWAKERYTVYFASATQARQGGYRPCKLCRPA